MCKQYLLIFFKKTLFWLSSTLSVTLHAIKGNHHHHESKKFGLWLLVIFLLEFDDVSRQTQKGQRALKSHMLSVSKVKHCCKREANNSHVVYDWVTVSICSNCFQQLRWTTGSVQSNTTNSYRMPYGHKNSFDRHKYWFQIKIYIWYIE